MKKALPFKNRNLASLALLSILVFSMFIGISALPMRAAATGLSEPTVMREEYEPLYPDIVPSSSRNEEPTMNIASNLDKFLATGEIPDALRSVDGALEVYATANRKTDLVGLSEHMKIVNVITQEVGLIIQGFVADPKAIYAISDFPGVGFVWGNEYANRVLHERPVEGPAVDNFFAREIMGINQAEAEFPDFNGTGVTIGIVDTGVDFGVTDLMDAIALDASGQPTSFDPGGSGIAITTFALPVVGGYLLTEGLDFRMYRNDGSLWWSNSTYGLYAENMYVSGITSLSGFYKVGMSVQIAADIPAQRAFFVFLLTDENTAGVYDTLYVDFETSWALTAGYNGISTSVSAEWDFTNDNPHMFDADPILAKSLDGDAFNDFSMGSLSNTFDLTGQISGDLVSGIDPQGRGFAFMYDNSGHGTSCAGTAAGRGIAEFDVYDNGTLYQLPGAAPGAKIMALKTFTIADDLWTWYWGCGYRPTEYPYAWFNNWTYVGVDQADILSNSWGWSSFHEGTRYDMVNSYDLYSMAMDYLTYESDTLFCVSTGNTGPGYGTISRPNSIFALMVGASTSHHIWQGYYSNVSQGYDAIADFTSVGPTPQGFLGIDILAVGAYAFDVLPLQGGDGNASWTIFGGTSQASPFAAGVAAIIRGAAGPMMGADMTRAVLMNGADDLGYDVYRQGAGRINAYKSLHMAFNNATDGTDPLPWINTYESWNAQYWGDRSDPWRGWYMNMYYSGSDFGAYFDYTQLFHMSWFDPYGLVDGAVFPGPIYRGDDYWFNVSATSANLNGVDSLTAYTYEEAGSATATLQSTSTYTTFRLGDNFAVSELAGMLSADYMVIHLSYPHDDFADLYDLSGQANYVFLHDFFDNNGNDLIDFGIDNVSRVASDTAYSNSHTICLGNPSSHFRWDPTIYYHDIGVELFLWRSLDVNVTVYWYNRVPWTWFSTSQYSAPDPNYPLMWNVSMDIPADTMPGAYEGYLEAVNGTGVSHMPISFRVDANMDQPGPAGAVSWGGRQHLPYDNGATYGNVQWGYRPQVGDWRFWFVDAYPYPLSTPPSYLFVNVTWTDPDTRLDVMLYYSSYGYYMYETDFAWSNAQWQGSSTAPTSQNILFAVDRPYGVGGWNYTWFSRGYFGIAVRTSQFGASTGGVEDIYVTCSYGVENHPGGTLPPWTPPAPTWGPPDVWLNATDSITTMAPLVDNSNWTGPEITFHANWSTLYIPEFPSISIHSTSLDLLSTVSHQNYGTIEGPVIGGWNPDLNPREDYDYVDLLAGQTVSVWVEFGTWDAAEGGSLTHAGDIDVFVWAPGVAHTYANSLTGATTATGANPEEGEFTAPVSGTYTIGLDYYSGPVPMAWKTDVYAFQASGVTESGLSADLDTSMTNTNARYDVRASFSTGTTLDQDSSFSAVFLSNIGVTNFFAPTIDSLDPDGGETVGPEPFEISWTASDPNTAPGDSLSLGELLGFSVEVSNDSGLTWKVVTYGTTLNSITYDPNSAYYGLGASDQWLVRINCTDGMYTTSRTSAATFTVEPEILISPPPYELYVVIAVIVIVVIILLVTCLLKRRQTVIK